MPRGIPNKKRKELAQDTKPDPKSQRNVMIGKIDNIILIVGGMNIMAESPVLHDIIIDLSEVLEYLDR